MKLLEEESKYPTTSLTAILYFLLYCTFNESRYTHWILTLWPQFFLPWIVIATSTTSIYLLTSRRARR
ncbi:6-hydroxy-D-nicotine oxidase [Fusarium oxysporum f. sp. albedinis]|nr:6-hydroxy-D-nicotine oxidase [Fusarium oxysporum f. sp. albedinis]